MSNSVRETASIVFAKVAAADGDIHHLEHELIGAYVMNLSGEDILEKAAAASLDDLLPQIFKDEDKFFIRVRANLVAEADGVVTQEETEILNKVNAELSLPAKLEQMLKDLFDKEFGATANINIDDVRELYFNSSFAPEE